MKLLVKTTVKSSFDDNPIYYTTPEIWHAVSLDAFGESNFDPIDVHSESDAFCQTTFDPIDLYRSRMHFTV